MKPTAGLINIGRSPIVDYEALRDKLDKGELAGAVLDVHSPEPLPADSPLWTTKNLIITPHISCDDPRYMDFLCDTWFSRDFAGKPLATRSIASSDISNAPISHDDARRTRWRRSATPSNGWVFVTGQMPFTGPPTIALPTASKRKRVRSCQSQARLDRRQSSPQPRRRSRARLTLDHVAHFVPHMDNARARARETRLYADAVFRAIASPGTRRPARSRRHRQPLRHV